MARAAACRAALVWAPVVLGIEGGVEPSLVSKIGSSVWLPISELVTYEQMSPAQDRPGQVTPTITRKNLVNGVVGDRATQAPPVDGR